MCATQVVLEFVRLVEASVAQLAAVLVVPRVLVHVIRQTLRRACNHTATTAFESHN